MLLFQTINLQGGLKGNTMAKKPRTNPSAEFVKNSADIIKALLTSAYAPIARLASVDAYEAARDRVTTLLNVPDSPSRS